MGERVWTNSNEFKIVYPVSLNDELRQRLESEREFQPLLRDFIKRSVKAQRLQDANPDKPLSYSGFYERFINSTMKQNANNVFKHCESPIERIFLNSLILLFLKNQFLGLQIQPPSSDIEQEMLNFRTIHKNILSLEKQYREMTGDDELTNFKVFFFKRISLGEFTEGDYDTFMVHTSVIRHFDWDSYHLTIQPGFPNFYKNKGVRPDLLLWCPGDENVKIIIECDGFKYHGNKSMFESDRKRDRIFQTKGYSVIRYSGAEINRDPFEVASDLFDTATSIDKNEGRIL